MEASAGLVAGSHNRNELVVIQGHEEVVKLFKLQYANSSEENFIMISVDIFTETNYTYKIITLC